MTDHREMAREAARRVDWTQVVLNGGPPCFRLMEDGDFCLRAERWAGHEPNHDHEFVPLAALLDRAAELEREACAKIVDGHYCADADCPTHIAAAIRARGGI